MIKDINKYVKSGKFNYKVGDRLSTVSKDVPNLPGVYFITTIAERNKIVLYIGKSGSILNNGIFKDQMLRGRINNKQGGVRRESFYNQKMTEGNLSEISFNWFVTYYQDVKDLPGFVEGLLIQHFFETHNRLPKWNICF